MKHHADKFLNYSFANIDVENYIPLFLSNREAAISNLLQLNFEYQLLIYDNYDKLKNSLKADFNNETPISFEEKQGFETYKFLQLYYLKTSEKEEYDDGLEKIINKLQKKFEIFHRLFSAYDKNLMKSSAAFKNLEIYALFSIILQLRFIKSENYNDFSTALKLNDLILNSGYVMHEKYNKLILFSFIYERIIIARLYDN